jgi:catechol 2,3-dioxygenase-like lactoylglutathione lyase family enzyme
LLDGLAKRRYDLSRLFILGSGGAILSPHNKQAFLEQLPHVTIVDGFGASETGAHGSHASRAGEQVSTGSFAMQNTIVLRDDLSAAVEPGSDETGWVGRSGHVPLGYYKDAAKTARTFPVLRGTRYAVPGDHARVLADGTIVVLGRGSVSINTGGEKVYAEEVEQVLRRHPAVYDAVVVGTPDERFGEQVTAVIQPRAGGDRPPRLTAFATNTSPATSSRRRPCSSTRWYGPEQQARLPVARSRATRRGARGRRDPVARAEPPEPERERRNARSRSTSRRSASRSASGRPADGLPRLARQQRSHHALRGEAEPIGSGGVSHFGFALGGDLDASVRQVEQAGGKLLSRGEHAPGVPFAYFADPDGYVIELGNS